MVEFIEIKFCTMKYGRLFYFITKVLPKVNKYCLKCCVHEVIVAGGQMALANFIHISTSSFRVEILVATDSDFTPSTWNMVKFREFFWRSSNPDSTICFYSAGRLHFSHSIWTNELYIVNLRT